MRRRPRSTGRGGGGGAPPPPPPPARPTSSRRDAPYLIVELPTTALPVLHAEPMYPVETSSNLRGTTGSVTASELIRFHHSRHRRRTGGGGRMTRRTTTTKEKTTTTTTESVG